MRRGSIGVHAQSITPWLSQALNLPLNYGAILGDVFPDSPAEEAGLKTGDIVLRLARKPMENGRQLAVNLYQKPIGERVLMDVLRGQDTLEVSVEVVERADDPGRFSDFVNPEKNLIPELGIMCVDLNEGIIQMYPTLRIRSGVVVAARALDAPFWDDGFLPGDIIHELNGEKVESLEQLKKMVAALKNLDPVAVHVERNGRLFFLTFQFSR